MFIRIAKQKRGDKIYRHLQVAESYRDPNKGGSPRTRIIAHLGTVEGLGKDQIERLIVGLQNSIGKASFKNAPCEVAFAQDFGHVHALSHVWNALGLSRALTRAGLNGETTFNPVALVKLLVINRICDPCSKLALLDWLDSVYIPGFEEEHPAYHHLLRAMDRLIAVKEKAEPIVARLFRDRGKPEGDLVFYDITSTWFDGDRSLVEDDIRRFCYSRDGHFDRRQITIGVVMGNDSIPLCHHVFPGNTVDKATVVEVVEDLKSRFKLRSVIFVGELTVKPDKKAREWEDVIDGMLLLETTDLASPAEEIVKRYKELAEIERGWRALKSTLLLRPVYHWTEERIRAQCLHMRSGAPG